MLAGHGPQRRSATAGFTLVELMMVVLITGILATVGVVLVRKHFAQAKANQALVGLQAIRVGEEGFRAHNGQYQDCSGKNANWYPTNPPDKNKHPWNRGDADAACWMSLGLSGTTMFSYLVNAGRPGDGYPVLQTAVDPPLATPAPDLWYVIQFKGNVDGDTDYSYGVATSMNGEVYVEDEGE